MSRKKDDLLDHEADGIREFDNDLPRWWLYGFYFTIVIAVAYMVNFHMLATPLVGARSNIAEYDADVLAHPKAAAPVPGSTGTAVLAVSTDPHELAEGKALYESQTHPCHACHRADLGGLVGPDLTDAKWLHGCSVRDVAESIRTGFPMKGMVPYGGGPALDDDKLLELASYILSKQGSQPPAAKPADPERDRACP